MRSWLTRMLIGAVAVASIAGGPAAVAVAKPHHARHQQALRANRANDPATPESSGEQAQGGEADNDSAQQAAACQQAGVDPNGSNVQYDDQTGTCSSGGGGSGGDQTQQ